MKRAPEPRFTVGDTVQVKAVAVRVKPCDVQAIQPRPEYLAPDDLYWRQLTISTGPKDDGYRCWVSEKCVEPLLGVIVGLTTKQDGWYAPASGGRDYYGESDYEPASWTCARVHSLWLVRTHLRGAEVMAFDAAVHPYRMPDGWRLPWHTGQGWGTDELAERAKAHLRAEMTAWPRDARGRWRKQV